MFELFKKVSKKINDNFQKEVNIYYDLRESYISIYGDVYGVVKKKRRYLNNPYTKSHSYFTLTIFRLIFILIINIFCFMSFAKYGCTGLTCVVMCCLPILYFILAVNIIMFMIKVSCPSKRLKGHFKLDKEGLTDYTDDGIRVLFEWKRIKLIVIKKNAIVILTDTPCYFYVNPELEKQLVGGIRRFKSDIEVIRQYD